MTPVGYGVADVEAKTLAHAFGQNPLPATEREPVQQHVELVDEIMDEQCRHQLAAAIRHDVLAHFGLE